MADEDELFAGAPQTAAPPAWASRLRQDERLLQPAQRDLQLMKTAGVNLLVVGMDSAIQSILDLLLPVLEEPIATWQPGERLILSPAGRGGTLILHDVGNLTPDDQRRLLEWLQPIAGRTRLVSTTATPLYPRVEAGAFIDTLYYRLNTVYVDMTA